MNRRAFLATAVGAAAVGVGGTIACIAGARDTHEVEVTRVPLHVGLVHPLRVALLGDIHFDPLYEEDYIAGVVELVNRQDPDLIFLTGDFITGNAIVVNRLAHILAGLKSRLATYTIPGNHEHWTGLQPILDSMRLRAGMRILMNQFELLPGEKNVYLTGIDSFWAGTPDLGIFDRAPSDARHIVLVHEPDSFGMLKDPRICLQLSGHTHGGQVRLPLYGALVLPVFGHDYPEGLFVRDDGRMLYVNRGIGTLRPHIRINCRPEITMLELT
jgi:predicted MPP superfamily phosphohydrolase